MPAVKTLLDAIARSDTAIGFTLDGDAGCGEIVESIPLEPEAVARGVLIRFNNGFEVLPVDAGEATVDSQGAITLPRRVKFRLFRKIPVYIGGGSLDRDSVFKRVKAATVAFFADGGLERDDADRLKVGLAAALGSATQFTNDEIDQLVSDAMEGMPVYSKLGCRRGSK